MNSSASLNDMFDMFPDLEPIPIAEGHLHGNSTTFEFDSQELFIAPKEYFDVSPFPRDGSTSNQQQDASNIINAAQAILDRNDDTEPFWPAYTDDIHPSSSQIQGPDKSNPFNPILAQTLALSTNPCNTSNISKLMKTTENSMATTNLLLPFMKSKQKQPVTTAAITPATITSTPRVVSNSSLATITANQSGKWNERFQDLQRFRKEYGHCCVPSHWPQNPALAQWVKRQRYQCKLRTEGRHSTMTEDRKRMLDDIGFVWDPHTAFWEEHWNELCAFREKHGHCAVPTKYEENPQLAVWAKCQRRQYKLFRTEGPNNSNMTMERIRKLQEVGFEFNPRAAKKSTKGSHN